MLYNKLVRDNIPDILKNKEVSFTATTIDYNAFGFALGNKLVEEAQEFNNSGDKEELADLFEVIDALLAYNNWTVEEIREIQKKEANKRGRFTKRILLIEAE